MSDVSASGSWLVRSFAVPHIPRAAVIGGPPQRAARLGSLQVPKPARSQTATGSSRSTRRLQAQHVLPKIPPWLRAERAAARGLRGLAGGRTARGRPLHVVRVCVCSRCRRRGRGVARTCVRQDRRQGRGADARLTAQLRCYIPNRHSAGEIAAFAPARSSPSAMALSLVAFGTGVGECSRSAARAIGRTSVRDSSGTARKGRRARASEGEQ